MIFPPIAVYVISSAIMQFCCLPFTAITAADLAEPFTASSDKTTPDQSLQYQEANDKKCKVSYFDCTVIHWNDCNNGEGQGICIDLTTNTTCDVQVNAYLSTFRVGVTLYHCLEEVGCGVIGCPARSLNATGESCLAIWGWSGISTKTQVTPAGCMHTGKGKKNISRELIFALSFATAVTILVGTIGAVIIYKCRKPNYERIH